mmetsp:Transcript_33848/g.37835  ORF Transcript_33848/g.37835 Transcript_33848/m.37835 type:complete len:80 (+) Transcript_33848:95-334(+)
MYILYFILCYLIFSSIGVFVYLSISLHCNLAVFQRSNRDDDDDDDDEKWKLLLILYHSSTYCTYCELLFFIYDIHCCQN